jgi:hypothetical protein
MRCTRCGWVIEPEGCPCRASVPQFGATLVPVGKRVVMRPGHGPSMPLWTTGEVIAHLGPLHQVDTRMGSYWCEIDDLLPETPEREQVLADGTRVWALWVDGRWYPGLVDGVQGSLRHVAWDDGDCMWLDAYQIVPMAAEAQAPEEGAFVLARHPQGPMAPARIEEHQGARYRVTFPDGEEAWVPGDDVYPVPPNPFHGA